MQVVPSTFYQCIKFPFNGTEVLFLRDNSMSINMLTTTKSLVPHNRSTNDIKSMLVDYEKKLKMMINCMEEYTLDSIVVLSISPHSYGKSSKKMRPSSSSMTIHGTFVQSSIPLEQEKEDQVIWGSIYRKEENIDEITLTTPISPKRYGKGYHFLRKMDYQGHIPLNDNIESLTKPASHTNKRKSGDTIGLGYGVDDSLPSFDKEVPTNNESKDDV
jgi:hypothetical protein